MRSTPSHSVSKKKVSAADIIPAGLTDERPAVKTLKTETEGKYTRWWWTSIQLRWTFCSTDSTQTYSQTTVNVWTQTKPSSKLSDICKGCGQSWRTHVLMHRTRGCKLLTCWPLPVLSPTAIIHLLSLFHWEMWGKLETLSWYGNNDSRKKKRSAWQSQHEETNYQHPQMFNFPFKLMAHLSLDCGRTPKDLETTSAQTLDHAKNK